MAPKRRAPKRRATPTCDHPGCNRPATNMQCPCCHREDFITAVDILEHMEAPFVGLVRGNDILAVGKFTPELIKKISEPGDKLVDEFGRVGTYRPSESSSSQGPAPAPQEPFTGEAHKL